MSTGAGLPIGFAPAVVAALLGAACAGDGAGSVSSGKQVLVAVLDSVGFRPGQSASVSFVLTSDGVPVSGQKVAFTLEDAPASGVTLAANEAPTDVNGVAVVSVQATVEAMFHVVAKAGAATASVLVTVGTLGAVQVAPYFAPSSTAASATTSIDVRFLDGASCKNINVAHSLPVPPREVSLSPSGGTAEFDHVPTDESSAVVARALDRTGAPIAAGCVDLPGSALLPDGLVQVTVALYDTVPDPIGTFTVTSQLVPAPPLAAAGAVAAAWRDLSDCPLDPAQMWLDCTIDALSPATPDDPLDCIPSDLPGGEGPVGDALLALRGAPIEGPGGTVTGCRGVHASGGAVSLDALALGLFGSPMPAPIVALPRVAIDAAHILDKVGLTSTLDVSAGDRPDRFFITHTLVEERFAGYRLRQDDTVLDFPVDLEPLGLLVLTAQTTATTGDGQIFIADHGFTLRLGTAARAAFGPIALVPRGLPADVTQVPSFIASLVQSADGSAGCDALDEALCPLAGAASGCVLTACEDGLAALGAQLAASFDPADGPGLDLHLAGSAVLLDTTGSGVTHQLSNSDDRSKIAAWAVDLRTRLGRSMFDAPFTAMRN